MLIIVQFGNPLLPFPSLSRWGWAWHHIPEILMFLFFGMWWGEWKTFPTRRLQDVITTLIAATIMFLFSFGVNLLFAFVVGVIAVIPWLVGYLFVRSYSVGQATQKP